MISREKLKILTPLQKLPKNVGDLGKLIVAKKFAQSQINRPIWSHWLKAKTVWLLNWIIGIIFLNNITLLVCHLATVH